MTPENEKLVAELKRSANDLTMAYGEAAKVSDRAITAPRKERKQP